MAESGSAREVNMKTFDNFRHRLKGDAGQALIEFALLLPMIFLLVLNTVNFGGFFYAWITMANAARAGADYAVLAGASAGGLTPATGAQIQSMIATEIYSLPNKASLAVIVCRNFNGTITPVQGTCGSSVHADYTEPTAFVLTSVDVTYTYKPFIGGFSFPKLGVFLTIPPTTIHMTSQMRTIQ
jgi:Flp pilus assembly protein TadG